MCQTANWSVHAPFPQKTALCSVTFLFMCCSRHIHSHTVTTATSSYAPRRHTDKQIAIIDSRHKTAPPWMNIKFPFLMENKLYISDVSIPRLSHPATCCPPKSNPRSANSLAISHNDTPGILILCSQTLRALSYQSGPLRRRGVTFSPHWMLEDLFTGRLQLFIQYVMYNLTFMWSYIVTNSYNKTK